MTLTEAGRDAGALQPKGFVSRLDDELVSSCREGRWGSFLRAWFTAVVVAAAAGFAFPFVMCGAYLLVSTFVFSASNRGGPDLLSLCAGIAALAGGMCANIHGAGDAREGSLCPGLREVVRTPGGGTSARAGGLSIVIL